MVVPAIELEQVRKEYAPDKTPAVRDVSFSVSQGEVLALVGGSGSGKTTTLKMINRLIEPTAGTIRVMGEDVTAIDPVMLRRSIGYAFQGVGLFPHLTVGDNIAITPRLLGWPEGKTRARVDDLLMLIDLPVDTFRDRLPAALSGGQRQRVGFARALAAEPRAILMDEPFGALDPITRDTVQTEFREVQQKLGLSVVVVTHDMTEAVLLADRIAVMHEGDLRQLGTPQQLLTAPADDYVAQLIETPRRHSDFIESLMRPPAVGGKG
jgi:osmoprotectant transport system ATP-binding protein